jgi:iron complex transport system ATP-binding protein
MTLTARGLAIGYRNRTVAQGIDFTLARGEVLCLLGPNGSGKTTLLRTLLGLVPPVAGGVSLDSEPLDRLGAAERARRMAYVPQASTADLDFTVREVVIMGRTARSGLFSAPSTADDATAQATLKSLGLGPLADTPLARVSGGERQLTLIARALATEAHVLLMDEPTANLDFANQARVLEVIAGLRSVGKCVLFTTHHPDHALRIADTAVLLGDGRVLAQGPALSILNSANLSALYRRPIEVVEVVSNSGPPARVCVAR